MNKATRRVMFTEEVPVAGASQAELQERVKAWVMALPAPPKSLITTRELDNEAMQAASAQPLSYTYSYTHNGAKRTYTATAHLHYTTKLCLQEGRYRYEVTDFVFVEPGGATSFEDYFLTGKVRPIGEGGAASFEALRKAFEAAAAKLVANLKVAMNKAGH
ncbi:DUF4468 domain-containing protein [Hymenobacter koreensis]|uniref:DUF4468 domain-containing protein n=1 Tax=Hymenobacter koreensis TaxID=1084523 RepID=A0ABP8ITW6_9BACT